MKPEEICRKCQHWKHTMTLYTGEGIYSKGEMIFTCELKQKYTIANPVGNGLNQNQGAAGHLLIGNWFQPTLNNQPIQATVAPGQKIFGYPIQFAANPPVAAGMCVAAGGLGAWNNNANTLMTDGMAVKWPNDEYTIPKKCPFQLEHVLHGAKFMKDED